MNEAVFSSTNLDQLQRQLSSWRQRQSGRARLPPSLWDAAAQLARSQGVNRVARTLRLDFYKVQRLARSPALASSLAQCPTPFLELKLDAPAPRNTAVGAVEFFDGDQRRLRLETGHDPVLWLALAEAFWRPKS